MLFPLERLLAERGAPLCIRRDQTVREALTLMVQHDYSQLPVLDHQGALLGLISDETINRRYLHSAGIVTLLDLPVDHCVTPATTLPRDRDIFEALDRLKDVYAIVIISPNNHPEGILTSFDMAHFFRDLTEDLVIVEDIETSLRQVVQSILGDDEALTTALIAAFGEDKANPGVPNKAFDELSFGNLMYLIKNDANWSHFSRVFSPLDLFWQYLDQVRRNRNQLAHFRGKLDALQHSLLKEVQVWLAMRPNLADYRPVKIHQKDIKIAEETRRRAGASKYDALREYLAAKRLAGETRLSMSFSAIESIVGEDLPESSRSHRSWWANYYGYTQAKSWLEAGWLVDGVEMSQEEVNFRQSRVALYPVVFDRLLRDLKSERPGITHGTRVSLDNWYSFSAGKPGFSLAWVLPKEQVLRVELYIDTPDKQANKEAFDALITQRADIEQRIGKPLTWDRLNDNRASRISVTRSFDVADPKADRDAAIRWGVETMTAFYDVFGPRLGNL